MRHECIDAVRDKKTERSRFTARVTSFGSACLRGFLLASTKREPFAGGCNALSSAIAQRVSGTAASRLFLLCDAGIFHLRIVEIALCPFGSGQLTAALRGK